MTYRIIELANTHGGSIDYLNKLIDTFSEYNKGYGMKFQPFHAAEISTPDFQWYPVYQELLFSESQWTSVLTKANQTKDIWLDMFDAYSIKILQQNFDLVYGLKLQVSVLFNFNIIRDLSKMDLSDKKLIINVAALSLDEMEQFVKDIESKLNPEELLIEIGFQANPTELSDSGLSKIQAVKQKFSKRVVFADHIAQDIDYAIWMPAIAVAAGADVVEKHVMLDEKTKYDMYSSLTPANFRKMAEVLDNYDNLMKASFINDRERTYLTNSLMKPILINPKRKGQLINFEEDLAFKRAGKFGLNSLEIQNIQGSFHVLNQNKKQTDTIKKEDFKRANIAAIIAGRLKSSRLKAKALKKIGDLSSVEYCLKNVCRFQNVNHVILATSYLESDAELENYTYNDSVVFHKGHPEDVVQRYLDIIRKLNVDVIIRVTADMPFVDDEICQILLKSHFETGADFTTARDAAVGTNLEIITVEALERVKKEFPSADYSEYMTWYFVNNEDHFKINRVDLPEELIRDYRLTLDYQEDLELFNAIDGTLKEKEEFSVRDIFDLLDSDPALPALNGHLTLKYRTDKELIDTLNRVTRIHV